jgi:hypothetical protein
MTWPFDPPGHDMSTAKDWRYYRDQKTMAKGIAFNWIENKMCDLGSYLLERFPWLGIFARRLPVVAKFGPNSR